MQGRYWEIPRDAYPEMEQAAVILKSSKERKAAQSFLDYLKTPSAVDVMKRYGFRLPVSNSGAQK
jgi:molybdate transport system substrate-binding protein